MDSGKKIGDKEADNSTGTLYYGVYPPSEDNCTPNVYQDKSEALKVAKKNKKSRFKAFQFYHEAAEFSLNGFDFPNNNTTVSAPLLQKSTVENTAVGEKASPFKGPKPQELVELRKAIEAGNNKFVREIIWQNPRYLVSSGDTPSILQEGPRYNAMHVAAKSKNAEIAELILSTVSNTEFIKLLYGDDNQQNAEDRTSVLLDLYLNTPNKGLNETPLHFASKHGAADVVEILVSYPQCDKSLKNKYNKSADQMICERAEVGKDFATVKRKIEILLQDSYYVPVLRAEDRSLPPVVGEPFSPTHPPVFSNDPLSPRLEIHAYAGPMDKKGAQEFRKLWKTPPRSLNFSSPDGRKPNDVVNVSSLRFKDPEKGLERIGKRLAIKYDVNWKEYWPFLGSFVDITSGEGLILLERYLANRYAILNNSFVEELNKSSADISRIKDDILSPISELCAAFSACHLNDNKSLSNSVESKPEIEPITYIDKACQVFANRISNDILCTLCNDDKFIKALDKDIKIFELLISSYSDMLYILRNEDNILQVLETEIKQLELLISSYMDDSRFSSVNFQKVHPRLGVLIGQKLYNNIKEEVRTLLFNKIENILESITKSVDCFSSDDESHNCKEPSEQRKPTIYRKQIICLIRYILNVLSQNYDTKQISSEGDVKDWENSEACSCVYHARKFKKNNVSRSSSIKNSLKLYSRTELVNTSRKLCFNEDDDGDQNFVRNGINLNKNQNQLHSNVCDGGEDDNEDDEFYTPPSSPSLLIEDVESEDEFNDTELPKYDIFIEGELPTKIDCDVFNAINYSEVKLDSKQYPNIYKWHHTISLYSNAERESWPSQKDIQKTNSDSPVSLNSSITYLDSPKTSTPSKSWLRITGVNSPKPLLKSNSVH